MTTGRQMRRIGILGGMGPEATILLMSRIVRRTAVSGDEDHVPMLVDNNPQIPSRIAAIIEGTGEDPAPVLQAMARGLEAGGAEALAMPCNTAHHYAAAITGAVRIPLLDMIELTAERLAAMPGAPRRIGLLASPAVRMARVFDDAFARRGLTILHPRDEAELLRAIRAIKRSGAGDEPRAILAAAAAELVERGADALVVGCSEFSLVADAAGSDRPVLDTIDVLADAAIAFSLGLAPAAPDLVAEA